MGECLTQSDMNERQARCLSCELNAQSTNQEPQFIVLNFKLLNHDVEQGVQDQAAKIEVLTEFNDEDSIKVGIIAGDGKGGNPEYDDKHGGKQQADKRPALFILGEGAVEEPAYQEKSSQGQRNISYPIKVIVLRRSLTEETEGSGSRNTIKQKQGSYV